MQSKMRSRILASSCGLLLAMALSCANSSGSLDEGGAAGDGGDLGSGAAGDGGARGGRAGGGAGAGAAGGQGGNAEEGGSGGRDSATPGGRGGGGAGGGEGGGAGATNSGGAPPQGPLAEGLIGYWRFDEGEGADVADASGRGNHGNIIVGQQGRWVKGGQSGPLSPHDNPNWVEGKRGKALHLDGQTEWVRIPSSDSINETAATNAYTITAWVKLESHTDLIHFVLSRQRGTPSNPALQTHDQFGMGTDQRRIYTIVDNMSVRGEVMMPGDQWVHMAAVYDGKRFEDSRADILINGADNATQPMTHEVYINGKLVGRDTPPQKKAIESDTTFVSIGANQNIGVIKEFWHGVVDEVRLYKRALSSTEIEQIYQQP